MRQRVVIAAALISEPDMCGDNALLAQLCRVRKMALILITHDLSLASQI